MYIMLCKRVRTAAGCHVLFGGVAESENGRRK